MPILLQEAIERAKLSAGADGLISQYVYNQLTKALDEKDVHAFTIALVDLGILVKSASRSASEYKKIRKMFNIKKAQQYQQSDGGLWVPQSSWSQDDEADLSNFTELTDEDLEEITPLDAEAESLRSALEDAGVSVDSEGNVSFYKSNIPGIYNKKNPIAPMPLEKAIQLFQSRLNTIDTSQSKVDSLLDLLSKLKEQTVQLDSSLAALDKFKYDSSSRNEQTRDIANLLADVKEQIRGGNYGEAQESASVLQEYLDTKSQSPYDTYDEYLKVVDALDRLAELIENDPETFDKVVQGLGGVPTKQGLKKYPREDERPTLWIPQKITENVDDFIKFLKNDNEFWRDIGDANAVDVDYLDIDSHADSEVGISSGFDTDMDIEEAVYRSLARYLDRGNSKWAEFWGDPQKRVGVGVGIPKGWFPGNSVDRFIKYLEDVDDKFWRALDLDENYELEFYGIDKDSVVVDGRVESDGDLSSLVEDAVERYLTFRDEEGDFSDESGEYNMGRG